MVSPTTSASQASAHFLQLSTQYSSIAFLYFDYLLTFPCEVKYIWNKKFSLTTVLYFACRYALVANVLYVFVKTEQLGLSCNAILTFIGVISCLGRVAVIATLTGRTYAIYGCSRLILAFFGVMGLTCVVLDFLDIPDTKCAGSRRSKAITNVIHHHISNIRIGDAGTALSILMLVFESVAAVLLAIKCFLMFHGKRWTIAKSTIFTLMFEQGIVYFAIVSAFMALSIILNFRAPPGSLLQRLPNAFTLPLSCTLIARFILQLRKWQSIGTSGEKSSGDPTQTLSTFQAQARVQKPSSMSTTLVNEFGNGPSSEDIENLDVNDEQAHVIELSLVERFT